LSDASACNGRDFLSEGLRRVSLKDSSVSRSTLSLS